MFKKVETNLNFVDREKNIEDFWEKNQIFEKSMKEKLDENNKASNSYVFYDGPPTANGKPHIGHVETRAFKDLIPRFHTMKGSFVPRKAGWDTHGLPVELEVEKELNINGKEQIEQYGIEPFIKKCKENVWKYKQMWEDFSFKVGFWADMENPYVTYYDNYIESEWWALKQIYEKGLLYKGFKIVPYCPRCGTPLSSHEVAQGYKDVKDTTAIVRFKVKNEDAYFLAWTTTPWTLPSNLALCVNPNNEYVKVKCIDGFTYYLAKELCEKVFSVIKTEDENVKKYEILETYKGKDLEFKEYEPLFDYAVEIVKKQNKKAYFVTCDEYVTLEDGTGIVHIAPAFGEDDAKVCKKYDVAFVQFVDEKGLMTKETEFAGLFVKKADPKVLENLQNRNLLFDAPKVTHSYPHCWRCDTPLIYYARESWFIKMTDVKDDLIKNNDKITWYPDSIGKGRFGDWIKNVQDWGISRNRYWGTPLPIWEDEDMNRICIGSRKELKERYEEYYEKVGSKNNEKHLDIDKIEFHRPFIDDVKLLSDTGKVMTRVKEVIDCWFDSGAMPFAQHHYPFENKETFENEFPAQFICEAVDQTRGWFYSLLAESTLLFNKPCFEKVLVLGHVTDENGLKMSKSKGNAVDPMEALNKYGADSIRWFFYTNSAPWLPKRFSEKNVLEGQSKFLGTLQNVYAFFVLYANIDNFNPKNYKINYQSLNVMDKWLISTINKSIKFIDECLENVKVIEASTEIAKLVDNLSNWYVRRNRDRFWAKGMEKDKIDAYMCLYYALTNISKAVAPFVPFIAEEIYQNLVMQMYKENETMDLFDDGIDKTLVKESVHLCDYPKYYNDLINDTIQNEMDEAIVCCELGRACRNSCNIKNRQPLSSMLIKSDVKFDDYYIKVIANELNVHEVKVMDDLSKYTSYIFKPQLKTLGPKYGKKLNQIKNALLEIDTMKAYSDLNNRGSIELNIEGESITLTKEDLIIEASKKEGYVTEVSKNTTVVLDTNITDELIEEGYIREVVSKIQNMRKEANFEVMDLINIYVYDNKKIEDLIMKHKNMILNELMSKNIFNEKAEDGSFIKQWEINSENVTIGIKVVK